MLIQLARDCKWWIEAILQARRWDAPNPAPLVKRRLARQVARAHGLRVLVETGTYRGDMVAAARWWATGVHTIEVEPTLAAQAQHRFRWWRRVHVYEGDSANVLPMILDKLNAPALFWLDAHYCEGVSGRADTDTPVARELELVLGCPGVVLIDDARHFGTGDYPTIEYVEKMVRNAGRSMDIDLDIIRIT